MFWRCKNQSDELKSEIIQIDGQELIFLVNKDTIILDFDKLLTTQSSFDLYTLICKVFNLLKSVDSKGYLNTIDLRSIPLISNFLKDVVWEVEREVNGKKVKKRSISHIAGSHSMDTYKWLLNIILLNLFALSYLLVQKINRDEEGYGDTDFYDDLMVLQRQLNNSLDY